MNLFAGNEKLVFDKLDELVLATNRNSENIKVAVQGLEEKIVSSVQTAVESKVVQPLAGLKEEIEKLVTRVGALESRPTLDLNDIVSTLGDEVVRKFRGDMLKEITEEISGSVLRSFQDVMLPEVVKRIEVELPKDLPKEFENMQKEVQALKKIVADASPATGRTFGSLDRHMMEELWNDLKSRTGDHSKGEKSSVPSSGDQEGLTRKKKEVVRAVATESVVQQKQVTGTDASARFAQRTLEEAAGTDASEPRFESFPDIPTTLKSVKRKGKEQVSGEEEQNVEGSPESPTVDDDTSKKLQQQCIMIEIFKRNQKDELLAHQREMATMGTLDSYNAGRLGINIEVFKKMKDDPRVHQCLDALNDVHIRSFYAEEEQVYDSLIYGVTIPELIRQRREELVNLQRKIRKNAGALELEYRKRLTGLPKLTAKQIKAIKDADVSTFIPLDTSLRINRQQLQSTEGQQSGVSKETEYMVQMAKQKASYDQMINFRANARKIVDAEIKLAENHQGMTRFNIKLTREGNFTDERKDTTVQAFGWTELKEIGLTFKGKTDLSPDVKAFMKRVEKVWRRIQQMEAVLGLRPPVSVPSSPSPKRKATEDAPGQSSKRRA